MGLKVGDKLRRFNEPVRHVINVFEDDGNVLIVTKQWSREKQYWRYSVDYDWSFSKKFAWTVNQTKSQRSIDG